MDLEPPAWLAKPISHLLNDSIISYFYLFLFFKLLLLNPLSFLSTLSIWFLLWAQFLLKSSKALSHFHCYYYNYYFLSGTLHVFEMVLKKKNMRKECCLTFICIIVLFVDVSSDAVMIRLFRSREEDEWLQCGLLSVTALPSKHVYLNNKCLHLASKAFKWRACLLKATVETPNFLFFSKSPFHLHCFYRIKILQAMYGLSAASSISRKWENHFFLFAFLFRLLMSACYSVKADQSWGGAAGLARKEAHNINTKTKRK